MKVAITYENGEVFPHFGRTPQFKIYDIEENEIRSEQVLDTGEFGHGEHEDHGCGHGNCHH